MPRLPATAVLLPDGRVLVPGLACQEVNSIQPNGHGEGYAATQSSIYDPASGTWAAGPAMPHCVSTATALPNREVLITGWWDDAPPQGSDSQVAVDWSGLLDPKSGETRITAAPPAGRYMSLALLHDGRVLFVTADKAEVFQ